jgi:putative ABC transport system permease protein
MGSSGSRDEVRNAPQVSLRRARHGARSDGLSAPKLAISDLLHEAVAGVTARPGRSLLTALGTVLGVGSLIAILALASSASARISSRFDALRATEVVVSEPRDGTSASTERPFPADADRRLEDLNGVAAAGQLWTVADMTLTRFAGAPPESGIVVPVMGASPGALRAIHARYNVGGSGLNDFHNSTGQHVVVLGRSTAARLGVTTTARPTAIYIDGVPFTVTGIIEDTDREPGLLLGVAVPVETAIGMWGSAIEPRRMLIETNPGAAQLIARQAPLALRPDNPRSLLVIAPPDPQTLRGEVESDANSLVVLLTIVALAAGAITIANATLVAVLERIPEIGLRRALGASGSHIASQFLAESGATGFVGGLIGTCLGLTIAVVVTSSRGWTTVIDPRVAMAGPFLGLSIGIVAGVYPAFKATRVTPVAALRR